MIFEKCIKLSLKTQISPYILEAGWGEYYIYNFTKKFQKNSIIKIYIFRSILKLFVMHTREMETTKSSMRHAI